MDSAPIPASSPAACALASAILLIAGAQRLGQLEATAS